MRGSIMRISMIVLSATAILGTLSACSKSQIYGNSQTEYLSEAELQMEEISETVETEAAERVEDEAEPAYIPEKGSLFAVLPIYQNGEFIKIQNMGDGAEMLICQSNSADELKTYGLLLKESGFQFYAENQIDDNYYATWTDDQVTVTLLYTPELDYSVRIVAEPSGDLPGASPEKYIKVCDPLMTLVSTNYNGAENSGLCMIYRLSDGTFFIIDGGHNAQECADTIYETLVKLAPDPENIVITAWLITHTHNDHVMALFHFADTYADRVTVKQFISNVPSKEVVLSTKANEKNPGRYLEAVEKLGAELVEAHPGQIFYLADGVLEILYTWELYPVKASFIDNIGYNCTSLVFTLTMNGEKILHLGDCGPISSEVLTTAYSKNTLQAGILQVAHHGHRGATVELNQAISPKVALWATNNMSYTTNKAMSYNKVLEECVEYTYVAGREIYVFSLPFSPDEVEIWSAYGEE